MKPLPSSYPHTFPLCFSTLGSPAFTWHQVLEFAGKHKLQAVEIRCLENQVMEPALFDTLLPPPHQAAAQLAERKLQLGILGTSAKLLVRSDGELDDLCHFAQLADQLGTPWLRIFDGGAAAESPTPVAIRETTRFLETWSALKAQHGFKCDLAVETHDAMADLGNTCQIIRELPPFHVLWDTHHTWRYGESLAEYYEAVAERTVHFHVKDSVDRPSRRKPFTYVEPGTGEFPWTELREILANHPGDPLFSFEWEKHWNPELPDIEQVMPAFLRIMRPTKKSRE